MARRGLVSAAGLRHFVDRLVARLVWEGFQKPGVVGGPPPLGEGVPRGPQSFLLVALEATLRGCALVEEYAARCGAHAPYVDCLGG